MHSSKNWNLVETKKLYTVILITILVLSFFLTFFHLRERSLLDWDEAAYLNIVKTWRAGTDWFIYKIFNPGKIAQFGFNEYVLEYGGTFNSYAKDGFLFIVFLFSYLLGLRDVAILWVSGVFGILTVWLIYLIGKEVFNKVTALLSCGILAISVYHLHYSRSGFPQTTSVFFLYLAIFLYIFSYKHIRDTKTSRKFLFFTGISLGYAFTCHYNLFWTLPTFFLMEIASRILFGNNILFRGLAKRIFLLLVGILIPIFFWGGFSELIRLILYRSPSSIEAIRGSLGTGSYISYFGRLRDFLIPFVSKTILKSDTVYITKQINLLFYIKLLLLWEGLLIIILLSIGIIRLFYRQIHWRIFVEFIILIFFLIPLFFWSFYSWQLGRSFVAAIPAMALIIGSLLTSGVEKFCKRDATKTVAIFIILLVFIFQARGRIGAELSYVSGFPAAIKFMKEHSGIKHLSSQFAISRSFVGRKNALDISVSFAGINIKSKLKKLYDEDGYRYLLLDQMRIVFADSPIVQAADKSKPVFVIPHSTRANLFEDNKVDFIDKVSHMPEVLMVYDLIDIINNIKN